VVGVSGDRGARRAQNFPEQAAPVDPVDGSQGTWSGQDRSNQRPPPRSPSHEAESLPNRTRSPRFGTLSTAASHPVENSLLQHRAAC
jgi:hypothetical protein